MTEKHCPECQSEQLFYTPPCDEGHGEECVDLACVVCGFALTAVGVLSIAEDFQVAA